MPWINFVFQMGLLSVNQISRQFLNDPGVIDVTGAQMVLVMKLTAFAWNVADGKLPEKDLSDYQKERALKQLPPLLDFAGYVLFFPALFAGPAFDYVDYRRWIDATMFEVPEGVDPSKRPRTRKQRKIPRSGTPAAWKAASGAVWVFVFLKLSANFYPEFLTGDEYMKYGFIRRVFILHMLGFTTRTKYYGVWALTEGACILSGLGYKSVDPVTGKVSWDRLRNVSPWGVESAQNTRAYLGNWNINTNNWLRNYMYLRVTPRGKKPGFRASMATFVTSAFWHGFYPGYYLSFVLASFVQTVAKSTYFTTSFLTFQFVSNVLTSPRRPPLCPAIFPRPQDGGAHIVQDLLRHRIIRGDAADILIRRRPLRDPDSPCLSPRVVARLLLRHHRYRPGNRLLCLAREGVPDQAPEETIRGGRREDDEDQEPGEHHWQPARSGLATEPGPGLPGNGERGAGGDRFFKGRRQKD